MLRILLAGLFVFASLTTSVAHPLEVVPSGHWAYVALRQLAVASLVPFHRLPVEPLTGGEIAALVREAREAAEIAQISAGVRDLLRALEAEFLCDDLDRVPSNLTLGLGAGTGSGLTVHPALAPNNFPAIGAGTAWGEWLLWMELGAGDEPTIRRAYASGRSGTVHLAIGRDMVRWGGSSPRTTLFLDAQSGSLDAFRFSVDWPHVRLTKVFSPLPTVEARYLVGTRVDWQVRPRLRIGFVELAVARLDPFLAYWILNPLPAVLTGPIIVLLQEWTGTDDNPLGGLEFDFLVRPGVLVYGQALVDDISTRGTAPNRVGGQVGVFWEDPFRTQRTSLRIEYSAVTNWTYTSMSSGANHFLLGGRPLGFWLGNDADDLYIELNHVLGPEASLTGWVAQSRHGEGRIGTTWTDSTAGFETWWLSGVVEMRHSLGIQYELRRIGGATKYWAEFGSVTNLNNMSGVTGWDYRLGIELTRTW